MEFVAIGDGRYRVVVASDGSVIHSCPTAMELARSAAPPRAIDEAERDAIRLDDEDLDDVVTERWTRTTDEPDIRGIDAGWLAPYGNWQVSVAIMEFVREGDPPYEDLRHAIEAALAAVPAVRGVQREDTEVWLVTGSPSGKELIESVARVLDERAEQLRAWYHSSMS